MELETIVFIAVLVISVIFHEVAHGYAANALGDPTAKMQGRLSLNPLRHIDLFGSIILPAILVLSKSSVLFGWAKPVPYNPYNLKRGGRFAEAIVAFAGPLANFALAAFVLLLYKLSIVSSTVAATVIYMNLFLAFLNLIPIAPLDGSKILPALLPEYLARPFRSMMHSMEQGGFITMILLLIVLSQFFAAPLANFISYITAFLLSF